MGQIVRIYDSILDYSNNYLTISIVLSFCNRWEYIQPIHIHSHESFKTLKSLLHVANLMQSRSLRTFLLQVHCNKRYLNSGRIMARSALFVSAGLCE